MSGVFVVVEGLDGTGKTTLVAHLASRLREMGEQVVAVRDPGSTPFGEDVRRAVLEHEVSVAAEVLAFAAARAELWARVIEPALAAGRIVLSDRWVASSVAYQGLLRGAGELVGEVHDLVLPRYPDVVLVLDRETDRPVRDRFEAAADARRQALRAVYRAMAHLDGHVLLDGSAGPEITGDVALAVVVAAVAAVRRGEPVTRSAIEAGLRHVVGLAGGGSGHGLA